MCAAAAGSGARVQLVQLSYLACRQRDEQQRQAASNQLYHVCRPLHTLSSVFSDDISRDRAPYLYIKAGGHTSP